MTAPFHLVLICFVLFFRLWIMLWVEWDKGRSISRKAHIWRWILRAIPVVLFCLSSKQWYAEHFPSFWPVVSLACVFAAWFWIDFDISKNAREEKPIEAIGNTAFFDRIFPNFAAQFFTKMAVLIMSLYFFIQWSL